MTGTLDIKHQVASNGGYRRQLNYLLAVLVETNGANTVVSG
jgi:hypothetical protein